MSGQMVELFFVCPEKNAEFGSFDYSLKDGYEIFENDDGTKQLKGVVELRSLCPLCGNSHTFSVEQVLCSMRFGEK